MEVPSLAEPSKAPNPGNTILMPVQGRSMRLISLIWFLYQTRNICPNCLQHFTKSKRHSPGALIVQPHGTAQDEITCFRISETWRKHATPCFRYVYVKVVRFRCIRSNGNARKRHETGNGNTGYPSCFRNGLTCFCHVSVYRFMQFRPVLGVTKDLNKSIMVQLDSASTCNTLPDKIAQLLIPLGQRKKISYSQQSNLIRL